MSVYPCFWKIPFQTFLALHLFFMCRSLFSLVSSIITLYLLHSSFTTVYVFCLQCCHIFLSYVQVNLFPLEQSVWPFFISYIYIYTHIIIKSYSIHKNIPEVFLYIPLNLRNWGFFTRLICSKNHWVDKHLHTTL